MLTKKSNIPFLLILSLFLATLGQLAFALEENTLTVINETDHDIYLKLDDYGFTHSAFACNLSQSPPKR